MAPMDAVPDPDDRMPAGYEAIRNELRNLAEPPAALQPPPDLLDELLALVPADKAIDIAEAGQDELIEGDGEPRLISRENYSGKSTEDLVELAQLGNEDAFRVLTLRTEPIARGIIVRAIGDVSEVDDVMQEAHLRWWKHLPKFEKRAKFTTWATEVALNSLRSRHRKAHNHYEETSEMDWSTLPSEMIDHTDPASLIDELPDYDLAQLSRYIMELTDRPRNVLMLRYFEEMSHAEIAEKVGISESGAKVALWRAHEQLRRKVSEESSEQEPSNVEIKKPEIDEKSYFMDLFRFSAKDGFQDIYLLLPTRYHDVLRWFMTTGTIAGAATETGIQVAECAGIIQNGRDLLKRGTNDFHQYAVGGESPRHAPLRALSVYPIFNRILHAADLPDATLRAAKDYLSRKSHASVADTDDAASRLHKRRIEGAVHAVGKSVIGSVKFENRFPMRWLQTVWRVGEYAKYKDLMEPAEVALLDQLLSHDKLQEAAHDAGADLMDYWRDYRMAITKFMNLRLKEWQSINSYTSEHADHLIKPSDNLYDAFHARNGLSNTFKYIAISRGVFKYPFGALSEEMGLDKSFVFDRYKRAVTKINVAQDYYEKGFRGYAYAESLKGRARDVSVALLAGKISAKDIDASLNKLDENSARAYRLRFMDCLSAREAAAVMGISFVLFERILLQASNQIASDLKLDS